MQIRHQIDLMVMGQKGAVKFNGLSYRYVLSVMDVFSRFVWLRRSSPYHPQSQGKVELSHRALRSKMEYDIIQMGSKGVNWVQRLPNYQRILNEDPKEVLAYKTPFEVYFAHKCNSYNTAMTDEEVVENAGKCNPSEGDQRRRSKHASLTRKKAAKASEKCSEW